MSTEMALLQFVDKITKNLHEKNNSIGIFLDLSKAFDTVNHNILLTKLENYGIKNTVLTWVQNYLEEREQFVYVNNLSSSRGKLLCGIPQGSILGPLLFLIYINDLRVVCKNVMPLMFADDTCLLLSHSNIDTLIREANEELQNISKWFKVNQLSLNIQKTNFMIFSTKTKEIIKI